jgi:hypothetical protein
MIFFIFLKIKNEIERLLELLSCVVLFNHYQIQVLVGY